MRINGKFTFKTIVLAMAGIVIGGVSMASAAAIGIDVGSSAQGMTATDTAGISTLSGARIANYNSFTPGPTSQGDARTLATLQDNSGTTVSGASATITGGSTNYGGSFAFNSTAQTNDAQLFNTVFDQYNGTAGSLSVTGIPYASYSLIAYVYNDTGSAGRGGTITVGSTTYYIATGTTNGTLTGIGNPDATGAGYVRSTDTTAVTDPAAVGNYVEFDGLTGSSLTASFVATNSGTARLKIAGFEIVQTPEPASIGLFAAGSLLLGRRRRTR